jgi:hypothetical protein
MGGPVCIAIPIRPILPKTVRGYKYNLAREKYTIADTHSIHQ